MTLVSRLDHAGYLGSELARVEIALDETSDTFRSALLSGWRVPRAVVADDENFGSHYGASSEH